MIIEPHLLSNRVVFYLTICINDNSEYTNTISYE